MSIDPIELRQRWRGVAKRFPLWRFPLDLFFDPNSWRMVGGDLTSLVLDSKNARLAAQALVGASSEVIEAIASVARVNEARANDVFKAVLLGYVTIPIALTALLSDAAPDFLSSLIEEYIGIVVVVLIGAALAPIIYFCGSWRAKQISWVIDLFSAGALAPTPAKPQ